MISYFSEIKKIVEKYGQLRKEMDSLIEQVESLDLRKKDLEHRLSQTREEEIALIDKIKIETGEDLDFYKILLELKDHARLSEHES